MPSDWLAAGLIIASLILVMLVLAGWMGWGL
jgi:hypothetical protein